MKLNKSRGCLIAAGLGAAGIILAIVAAGAGLLLSSKTNTPPRSSTAGNGTPGPIAIAGTYEQHTDMTNTSNDGSIHTVIDMVGNFHAASGIGNTMTGEAQITFNEYYEFGGVGCKISWSTGNIEWSPQLSGTYQKNADGSIAISLLADPTMSPTFSEDYVCVGKTPANAPWPAVGGTLVNGLFDFRQDIPMTGDATGTNYFTWHMELVPGQ